MTGFRVECSTRYCHHEKRVEFGALGLPDDTVFLEIQKLRRFVCEKCGGREATVGADWNEYYDALNRRRAERPNDLREGFDVMTTNTASASMPATYVKQREKCEKLLKLAKELEQFARARPDNFLDDRQFRTLLAEFHEQYKAVHDGMS
ncbi:hypothetical protein [Methylocella sp.]|jgi:hypothetical protein|uniref:hypothetical protein n=1 Tax=Methylocella sp. TaxID=1978226 RepID=UPI003C28CCB4